MQALIKMGSSQYLVSVGQELLVEHPTIDAILMVIDADSTVVGQPSVPDAQVKLKVLGEEKGKKVRVSTYKAKSRIRKVRGFRPQYTRILIEDISLGTKSTKPTKPAPRVRKTRETKS